MRRERDLGKQIVNGILAFGFATSLAASPASAVQAEPVVQSSCASPETIPLSDGYASVWGDGQILDFSHQSGIDGDPAVVSVSQGLRDTGQSILTHRFYSGLPVRGLPAGLTGRFSPDGTFWLGMCPPWDDDVS